MKGESMSREITGCQIGGTVYTPNGLMRLSRTASRPPDRPATAAELIAVSHWYGISPRVVRVLEGTPALAHMVADLPGDYDDLPYRSRAAERRQRRKLLGMMREAGLLTAVKVLVGFLALLASAFMLGVIVAKGWY